MSRPAILIYDCTLREGAQAPQIAFTLEDKLRITAILDELGVAYTEGGWPTANPKDLAYFHELRHLSLQQIKVVGFASAFSPGHDFGASEAVRIFTAAGINAMHIFGKAWDFHVKDILGLSLAENLDYIANSIRYYKEYIPEVSFGAEHLFMGFKANPTYVKELIQTVEEAGADWLDLADTNGGSFPQQIGATVAALRPLTKLPLAVHCHDDTGCAVANTIAAITEGVTIAEGTINGYAERCQMTDLCTLIPNLQLKLGYDCLPPEKMASLTTVAHQIADIVQVDIPGSKPYVGKFAFTHKGGLHVDAIIKNPRSYQHIDPALVGNTSAIVLSDQSGRQNLRTILHRLDFGSQEISNNDLSQLLSLIKDQEKKGCQFDLSSPSLELLIRRHLGLYRSHLQLACLEFSYRYQSETNSPFAVNATLRITHHGGNQADIIIKADQLLSFAELAQKITTELEGYFLAINGLRIMDYQVRIIHGNGNHDDRLRVLLGLELEGTKIPVLGFGNTFLVAALHALLEGIEYILNRSDQPEPGQT